MIIPTKLSMGLVKILMMPGTSAVRVTHAFVVRVSLRGCLLHLCNPYSDFYSKLFFSVIS